MFDEWLRSERDKAERGKSQDPYVHLGLRFAFYGRTSTTRHQDARSSRAWQLDVAWRVVDGHGTIVESFFDEGCSRLRSWDRRPEAARLLAALADPARRIEAVVLGEFERGFAGRQIWQVAKVLTEHDVRLWLPETDGPVDFDDPEHRNLMRTLAAQSQREAIRSRTRSLEAMRAQTREQGRYLGGRAPYGYRLVDGGPHPNRAHAKWGRRLQRLEPDPATAPHVTWIFEQRVAGRSLAGIARALNERGVPSPSQVDRDRNRHRVGSVWAVPTVAAILGNPRYTGRQVWNRVTNDRENTPLTSKRAAQRPNAIDRWAVSASLAHTPLVGTRVFTAAQKVRAARPTGDGGGRTYLLSGLAVCGICGRRMDSHWVHGRAGYRCRHGRTSASAPDPAADRMLYWREDVLLTRLATALASHRGDEVAARDVPGLLRESGRSVVCHRETAEWDARPVGKSPVQTGS
ncbi:recombinase family protein [Saccharothrix violaceirubra]